MLRDNTVLAAAFVVSMSSLSSCRNDPSDTGYDKAKEQALMDTASKIIDSGLPRQSIAYLDSAFQQLKAPSSYVYWRKYNFKFNYYLNYEKDMEKSMMYVDSMFSTIAKDEKRFKNEYAVTVYSKGDVLMAQKHYNEAYEWYFKGKEFAKKELDTCSWSLLSAKMGMVRYRQADFHKAIPYFRQSFDENAACTADRDFETAYISPQSSLNAIALSFEKVNELDSAVFYYRQALDFIITKATNFPERHQFVETAKGVVFGNLGGVYAKMKSYREAEYYLKKSIDINTRPGYAREDAVTAQVKLASMYLQTGRYPESQILIEQISHALSGKEKAMHSQLMRLRLMELRASYYRKTGRTDLADRQELAYYQFRDSVEQTERGIKTVDVDQGLEKIEHKYKLSLLNKTNQLKSVIIVSILVFLAMLVYILHFVWKNLKRSKTDIGVLTSMNKKIREQNHSLQRTLGALMQSQEENTRIMKIVAHDLRNPVGGIAMIASMMLENKKLPEQDKASLEMIRDASNSSMEMIRQLLQIQKDGKELDTEPVDIHSLLNKCVAFLNLKASEKQQYIEIITDKCTLNVNRDAAGNEQPHYQCHKIQP